MFTMITNDNNFTVNEHRRGGNEHNTKLISEFYLCILQLLKLTPVGYADNIQAGFTLPLAIAPNLYKVQHFGE